MRSFHRSSTISLQFTHPDFPKSDWIAQLILKGKTTSDSFEAVADPDEEKFTLTISAEDSAKLAPGFYQIHYRYENGDGEVSFVAGEEIQILPAPTESGDHRSQFEKDLEAIDNAIRAKISGGSVEEYTIQTTVGQRSIKNMLLEDLRTHRRWIVSQIDKERRAQGKRPLSNNRWKKIRSNLGNQSPTSRRHYP